MTKVYLVSEILHWSRKKFVEMNHSNAFIFLENKGRSRTFILKVTQLDCGNAGTELHVSLLFILWLLKAS